MKVLPYEFLETEFYSGIYGVSRSSLSRFIIIIITWDKDRIAIEETPDTLRIQIISIQHM